jgi:hypothetical protein
MPHSKAATFSHGMGHQHEVVDDSSVLSIERNTASHKKDESTWESFKVK